jgi:hypothetical protein
MLTWLLCTYTFIIKFSLIAEVFFLGGKVPILIHSLDDQGKLRPVSLGLLFTWVGRYVCMYVVSYLNRYEIRTQFIKSDMGSHTRV